MDSSGFSGFLVTRSSTEQSMIKAEAKQRHERAVANGHELLVSSYVWTILKENPDNIQATFAKNKVNKSMSDIFQAIGKRKVECEQALRKLSQQFEYLERNKKETVSDGAEIDSSQPPSCMSGSKAHKSQKRSREERRVESPSETYVAKRTKSNISAHKSLNSDVYEFRSDDEWDSESSFSSSSSSSSSITGYSEKKSSNPEDTKSKYFKSDIKRPYADRKFELTPCLDKIVNFILDVVTLSQSSKGFGQSDLISVWNSLTVGENGERIGKLLMAAVLPADIGVSKVRELQEEHGIKEDPISLEKMEDFQQYLIDEVFNGSKVGFTLNHLGQYFSLEDSDNKAISSLPSKLRSLVNNTIADVMRARSNMDVAINKRTFKSMIKEERISELSLEFLNLIVQEDLKPEDFRPLDESLDKDTSENIPVTKGKRSTNVDSVITTQQIKDLQGFLHECFFQPWLLSFDAEFLRNELKHQIKSKF